VADSDGRTSPSLTVIRNGDMFLISGYFLSSPTRSISNGILWPNVSIAASVILIEKGRVPRYGVLWLIYIDLK
jgi:hypothetical protein